MLGRALSLICLAFAALALLAWSASYIRPTPATLVRARPDHAVFFTSRSGVLSIWTQEIAPPPPKDCQVLLNKPYHMNVIAKQSLFGTTFNPDWPRNDLGWNTVRKNAGTVFIGATPYTFTLSVRSIQVRWWMMIAIALIAPGLRWLAAWLRRRRIAAGRCAVCGYDLRASPERCPECGTPYNPMA